VFCNPEVIIDINIPATTPPVVSIEKDFPGIKLLISLAHFINLTKAKPEVIQKGRSTSRVKIIPVNKEGVSPGPRNIRDNSIRRNMEIKGAKEKMRLILLISFIADLPAKDAPIADPISHEPRNIPAINSYPPEIFIISLISRSWMEELQKPVKKRLRLISFGLSNWISQVEGIVS
jgi:hypothetical protein